MLGEHLRHIDELDASITRVTEEIGRRLSLPDPPPEGEQGEGEQPVPYADESAQRPRQHLHQVL